MPKSAPAYESARDAGLLERLVKGGSLVASSEVDRSILDGQCRDAAYVLEHPCLPFISYPYEWTFSALKAAALHHLTVQLEALDGGFSLSDATAYNIQFIGTHPIFIDHLSFRPYREGEVWLGHRQFCMQFLNPLILWSRLGVAPNHWLRGSIEGIAPEDLSKLLSPRHNLSWTIMAHVSAQAALQRRRTRQGLGREAGTKAKLSRSSFRAMLLGLQQFIERCRAPDEKTVWDSYASDNSYSDAGAQVKHGFVRDMVATTRPSLLLDMGCNTGDYSLAALAAGADHVIGFDYDFGALEIAFKRSSHAGAAFTPLWLDAANPSPAQGWAQSERKGLNERANADALVALAFIHHIAIARNVPLDMTLDWIMAMAPVGVLEFPPKEDPMVQRLLASREDIFAGYSEQNFVALIERNARIVKATHVTPKGRLLIWYDGR
jgi:ribosomal protein L11 methylase PrmA